MSIDFSAVFKLVIAVAGCGVLAYGVLVKGNRQRTWPLLILAVLSILIFIPISRIAGGGLVHRWEMFHYYLGAKYHAELGYKRLYACVAVADADAGVKGATTRRLRDLETDGLITTSSVLPERQERCTNFFSRSRWDAFARDVSAFRKLSRTQAEWERMQLDHGYNPPPLWTVTGRTLANLTPPTLGGLTLLAFIDLALMAACLALLYWGFGARVACVGAVFWGTQAAAEFGWTGGSLLRQDWLFCCVLGVVLLRKQHVFWAGAALATAALLRVFPVLLGFGLLAFVAGSWFRLRVLLHEHRRLLLGGLAASTLLVLASSWLVGLDSYPRFWDHIQLRNTSAISNHMGLETLFAYSPGARLSDLLDMRLLDPGLPWGEARLGRASEYRTAYLGVAGIIAIFVIAVCSQLRTSWLVIPLSLPLISAFTDPSCYYYTVWVLAAVLVKARSSAAVVLLGIAAAGQILVLRFGAPDQRYAALALLYVSSGIAFLLLFGDALARTRDLVPQPIRRLIQRTAHE